ncbi:hypothetical protein FBY35_5956 [Streptomyces sp. SLBN-118]|nr:hypothetical protein [Streptomyces sp. SLBN-118]TQK44452.1 hypothetical protein FBY35_5956 [Streptomyces sp. SLBN-118]
MTVTPAQAEQPARIPPVPGSIWCDGCGSWCLPTGVCGCNNR